MTRSLVTDLSPTRAVPRSFPSTKVVILAGGRGTRLKPYTSVLPKPLMPVGDRAILEIILRQLEREELRDVVLSVGHLGHLIEAVFGDGSRHGVNITYVREELPLGTAGPLHRVADLNRPFLMLNGDVITTLSYRTLLRCHEQSGNILTVATRGRRVGIDYGVVHIEQTETGLDRIVRYEEKPVLERMVSMGVYVVEPEALAFVPENRYFDFPDLVQSLLESGAPIGAFVHDGLWLDIGRPEDYEQATALWEDGGLGPLLEDVVAGEERGTAPVT